MRRFFSESTFTKNRVTLRPNRMRLSQRFNNVLGINTKFLCCGRCSNPVQNIFNQLPVRPMKISAHYGSDTTLLTVQSRFRRYHGKGVAEEMLRTATGATCTGYAHGNTTTDQSLHESPHTRIGHSLDVVGVLHHQT